MILKFFVRNYKSIVEEEIDFNFAEGKAPNGYQESDYFTFLSSRKGRCIPVLAIFGANGSGKSNILESINQLISILQDGYVFGRYYPNRLNMKYDTTIFRMQFIVNDNLYVYNIEYDSKEIKEEYLKRNNKFLLKTNGLKVESNILNDDKLSSVNQVFKNSCLDQSIFKNSLLTMCKKWLSGLNADISIAYNYLVSLVYTKTNNIPTFVSIDVLSGNQPQGLDKSFREIVSVLQKMDINVTNAKMNFQRELIKSVQYPNGNKISNWQDKITVYRSDTKGSEVEFKLNEESMGTRLLFGMLGVILLVLKEGRILFADELDRSLHPFILRELTRLFKDKSINVNNAQLIYSAHDTSILEDELLRISEAAFVTNTVIEGTKIKRLCDYNGISNADNFRKLYINCRLGAVPATTN